MKNILILTLLVVLSGCTISARHHHFKLVDHSKKEYDDFSSIWCFTSTQSSSVLVCSNSYRSRSNSIGLLLPIFPQWNRKSRLAYDDIRKRVVEFRNTDLASTITLSALNGIALCANKYGIECSAESTITILPQDSVWLKIPEGKVHEITVAIGVKKFVIELKEFSEKIWHLVSV